MTARLDEGDRKVRHLEHVADMLSDRVIVRERELRAVRAELETARAKRERTRSELEVRMRSLARVAVELDGVRRQARGQATRIRMRALRDAAELSDRIAELGRHPDEERERLFELLHEAIRRIGSGERDEEPSGVPAHANGSATGPPEDLFDGLVEVEIGPLSDFSQLVGFEDAAGRIGATSEISVKRFAQGRATLEMNLGEPVELLSELEQLSPFEFHVRDRHADRLVLDVGAV